MSDATSLPALLVAARRPALIGGLVLLAVSALAFVTGGQSDFFRGYLLGFLLILGLTLGSMGILFIHHLVGGAWGFIIQRMLEAATRNLPVVLVLFLPLLAHVLMSEHPIYHWAEHGAAEHDELLAHKAPYLNTTGFVIRAIVYALVWSVLVFFLNYLSKRQDETGDGHLSNVLGHVSAPGLVFYVFTMSFAAFDWAMSLDPHWFSTIYGLIFVVGQALSAMAFMLVVLPFARRNTELGLAVTTDRLHDLSKLMFAFTCLWAYVQLSQFLIIWYGNLPEEIIFYHLRFQGGFEYMAVILVFGQFVFPFLFLLSRRPKRSMVWAPRIAAWILVVRCIDLYWYLMPHAEGSKTEAHLHLHWAHLTVPLGLFLVWVFMFLVQLERRPLLPQHDPRWKEKMAHVH